MNRRLLPFVGLSLAASFAACGGSADSPSRADGSSTTCPPGYVCTPTGGADDGGVQGQTLTADAAPSSNDAGVSGDAALSSNDAGVSGDAALSSNDAGVSGDAAPSSNDAGVSGDAALSSNDAGVSGDAALSSNDAGAAACPPGYVCTPAVDGGDASAFVGDAGAGGERDAGADAPEDAAVTSSGDASSDGATDSNDGAAIDATVDGSGDATVDGNGGADTGGDAASSFDGAYGGDATALTDASDAAPPPSTPTARVLDFRVISAKYSVSRAKLVLLSSSPTNALHIIDPTTFTDTVVPLPLAPVAVALDPTGTKAAVAYDAHVSWVDLATGALTTTCKVSSSAYDVAVTTEGTAYVAPALDQWVSVHAADLTTCTETLSTGNFWQASHLALHPSERTLFAADQGLSPARVHECSLTGSQPSCVDSQGTTDWGTYNYCGNLWISDNGARIYTACGVTLNIPSDVTSPACVYGGTLEGVSGIQSLFEAPDAQRTVLIPTASLANTSADTQVRVHETVYLQYVTEYPLPPFPADDGGTCVAHGQFVFSTPDLHTLYAVVSADPSCAVSNRYAIATIVP